MERAENEPSKLFESLSHSLSKNVVTWKIFLAKRLVNSNTLHTIHSFNGHPIKMHAQYWMVCFEWLSYPRIFTHGTDRSELIWPGLGNLIKINYSCVFKNGTIYKLVCCINKITSFWYDNVHINGYPVKAFSVDGSLTRAFALPGFCVKYLETRRHSCIYSCMLQFGCRWKSWYKLIICSWEDWSLCWLLFIRSKLTQENFKLS